jgi:hypothetical protein
MSEEAFDMARARKLLPWRGRVMGRGWQDFSVDDALAVEAAAALSRQGVKKADAREIVDLYFDVALERAAEQRPARSTTVLLGVVSCVGLTNGMPAHDGQFPLVGSPADVAEELARIGDILGADRWLDGVITINLNLCAKIVSVRAAAAGMEELRLVELAELL